MFMLLAGGAMAGMGAMQAYNSSKAQHAMAVTQHNDNMLKQSMQSGVELFQNAQANVNRMIANKNIATAAMENLVKQQGNVQRGYEDQNTNLAKQFEAQRQTVSKKAAAKLGRNSGTYKLAVDKMKEQGAEAFAQAAQNKYRMEQDIEQGYQNNLSQRDLMTSNQTAALIPGVPPAEPNHTAAAVQGGMQGFSTGVSMAAGMGNAMQQAFGQGSLPSWMRMPTK